MSEKDTGDDGLAVARDVSDFFDCELATEEEFRNEYQRLHLAQDGVVASAKDAAPTVVLAAGDAKVALPEESYIEMLAEHGLKPPVDGKHSALAVLWLAKSAEKRGLTQLSKNLMDLRNVGRGLVFVRRPDGAFYTPKPVVVVKVARTEEDQQAVAAEVEDYFGRGGR
jgi:hypothetical protein